MGVKLSEIMLAKVTYSDLGAMYFSAVNPMPLDAVYSYLSSQGDFREAVVLWTCNRFEIYFVPLGSGAVEDVRKFLDGKVSAYDFVEGEEVIRHLFRVAAGLDSMIPGEGEILSQVRQAWNRSKQMGFSGPVMNSIFMKSLEVGRNVRAEIPFGMVRRSFVREAADRLEKLDARSPVLVVGAGRIGRQMVKVLKDRGHEVWVTNRTEEKARALALQYGALFVPFERTKWKGCRTLFVAIRSERILLHAEDLSAIGASAVMDISTPPVTEVNEVSRIRYATIETIASSIEGMDEKLGELISLASRFVDQEYYDFMLHVAGEQRTVLIKELFLRSERMIDEQLKKLSNRADFDRSQLEMTRKAFVSFRGKMMAMLISALESGLDFQGNVEACSTAEEVHGTTTETRNR